MKHFGSSHNVNNFPWRRCFFYHIIYVVLKDGGDTCAAFELAFTKFCDILSLSEINELIYKQILPHLKCKYDEVWWKFIMNYQQIKGHIRKILIFFSRKFQAIACIESQDVDSTMVDGLIDLIETVFQLFLLLSDSIHKKLEVADNFGLSHIVLHLFNTLHFLCKILPHNAFAR